MSNFVTLLVEDDAFQREVLAHVLKDEGFEVIECTTGEAAELIIASTGTELQVMTIVAGIGQTRGQGRGGQQGGGNPKLRFAHVDSPEVLSGTIAISSRADSRLCERINHLKSI